MLKVRESEVRKMTKICPRCFDDLPENANYCPHCGECVMEIVERTIQYIGSPPKTVEVSVKDSAISTEEFKKAR
jgi:predicted amidophosphoribosyltransferase